MDIIDKIEQCGWRFEEINPRLNVASGTESRSPQAKKGRVSALLVSP